jgi:hypothetical protein
VTICLVLLVARVSSSLLTTKGSKQACDFLLVFARFC